MTITANPNPDPHRPIAAHIDWHILNAANRELTPAEVAELDAVGERIRTADDTQLAAWGINSPWLRREVANLFAQPWPVMAR